MTIPLPAPLPHPSAANKIGYSLGNLGKSIVLTVFDTFLLYYLVRIGGFSPIAAGGLLTVAMLWDGCADVAVAYLADRHGQISALGRLILLGAPLCGLSFWLIFAIPPAQGYWAVAAAILLCRTGFTLCDIGHNTLLVRIATTAQAAATVSGLRLIFSACGVALVGLATATRLPANMLERPGAIAHAALAGAAIYVSTLVIAALAMRRLPGAPPRRTGAGAAAFAGGLCRNRAYRHVLALVALQAGLVPLFGRALPFIGEAAHGGAGWAGSALIDIAVAQALSLPVWMVVSRRRSPGTILAIAYGTMLLALGLLAGSVAGTVGLVLIGIAQAGMNMAIWAMLALSVRGGAYGGTATAEALPIGVFLAVLKGSAGLGNGLLAGTIALGQQACDGCAGDGAGSVATAALILPIVGCSAALALVLHHARGRRHNMNDKSSATPEPTHPARG